MTYTVADAEAAIARHPESLEQLSMAADLLQELGDQRGEDFSACLLGTITAEEVQRRHPADVSAMYVAAWAMDNLGRCGECRGTGRVYVYMGHGDFRDDECWGCSDGVETGAAFAARAEALRLLAECGKVGEDGFGYDIPTSGAVGPQVIPVGWYDAAFRARQFDFWWQVIPERLRLIDAYAQADPDTRRRWAEGTRAMQPRAEVMT